MHRVPQRRTWGRGASRYAAASLGGGRLQGRLLDRRCAEPYQEVEIRPWQRQARKKAGRSPSPWERSCCQECGENTNSAQRKRRRRAWREEGKEEGKDAGRNHRGAKGKAQSKIERHQEEASLSGRFSRGGCRAGQIRLGWIWRRLCGGREFRLCTNRAIGHRSYDEGPSGWPTLEGPYRKTGSDSPIQGHKRWHYEDLERSAGPTCAGYQPSARRCRQEAEEEAIWGVLDRGPQEGAGENHREEEEGQELQEKKEKAEEVGEWSDSELQRLLWRQLGSGGIGGGRELEFRARSPDEETISGEARECFSTPDRPYQISDGTGRAGGLARGEEGDGRSESGVLLSPAHKECLQLPPERTERDVHVGVCHRPLKKRRRGEGGGRFISKIYSDPPELTGPGVDSGTSHGVVPPGGCISSYLQYGPRHPPPYKTDGEGTRKGQLPLDGLARKRPCSWKGRLVIQRRRRQQRQERKGRSERKRKGQRMAEPRQRQQRVGKDTGQGRRRQVTALEQVPLATAVERTSLRLKDTSIADILMSCSTLGGAGCALAWWLANAEEAGNEWGNVKLLEGVFNPYVWRRARRSRQALPLSVGGFSTVLQVFQSASLETIREKEFVQAHAKQAWTLVGCFTCNALAGSPGPFPKGGWTKAEQRLVSAVERSVDRLMCHGQDTEISPSLIEKELKGKRVNYQGEETCTCHSLTLEQVTAALPPAEHGGSIELTRFLSESSVAFLQQPSKSIVEDTGQELPKLQGKIHIDGSDVDSIAQELVTRGVCRWIPLENVVRFRGELVLNGLFGVEKPGLLPSGKPPLRLIMNLVPSNAIIKDFPGLVRHLPQITSWMSVVMDEGEELRVWQSDMSNAFYLFSLPYNWSPLLEFNIIRNGATLGLPDHQQFALA